MSCPYRRNKMSATERFLVGNNCQTLIEWLRVFHPPGRKTLFYMERLVCFEDEAVQPGEQYIYKVFRPRLDDDIRVHAAQFRAGFAAEQKRR